MSIFNIQYNRNFLKNIQKKLKIVNMYRVSYLLWYCCPSIFLKNSRIIIASNSHRHRVDNLAWPHLHRVIPDMVSSLPKREVFYICDLEGVGEHSNHLILVSYILHLFWQGKKSQEQRKKSIEAHSERQGR